MAIKALNPFAPFWYTPRAEVGLEPPEPKPTQFKIRGLNGAEQGYVMPEIRYDEQERTVTQITGKGVDQILGYGLTDWQNFANDAGEVPFGARNFALIPHNVRVELAWQILGASFVSQEQKKT